MEKPINKISFCITSCNRFSLLEKTVDSFLELNKTPIEKYILNEDSTDKTIIGKILDKYGDLFHIIRTPKNEGLLKSIDNLYNLVDTPYIFHCEDDWEFKGNENFIQESLDILEKYENIHQVWIRKDIPNEWVDNVVIDNKFKMMKSPHLVQWCGFSFNPGLRRKKDYNRIFPKGFNEHRVSENHGICELECNNIARATNYRAASLVNSAVFHIGFHDSTKKDIKW
jgi:hypothetical protein